MRLLIVGSLKGQIGAASRIAMDRGAKVTHAESIDGALDLVRAGGGADLAMVDVDLDVASLIQRLGAERINLPVVAAGVATDTQAAVRAIRAGAKEYVPLPPDPEMIAAVLAAAAEDRHALVYADPAMARVVHLAEQVAPSDASILITGESGTGKEVIARHIHARSRRAKGRFVAVNCAAIPENLLESELFGHEKGAFTGAVARRIGKFEEAQGGTLLLDEVSEMDPRLQAKLLRAIQEREIDRVGGGQPVKIDVRILATTNRNLQEAVRDGRFREDLLFRLTVLTVALPPLRQRPADIPLLAEHFLRRYAEANGMPERPLSAEAHAALTAHHWPGNVREIENTLHRAVLLASGDEVGPEAILLTQPDGTMLPAAAVLGGQAGDADRVETRSGAGAGAVATRPLIGRTVASVERDLIIDTLRHTFGNRTHAATLLGISIRTLRNKLRQYQDEGYEVPAPGVTG